MTRRLLLIVAVAGAGLGAALLTWPRINDVETGRTPEYPDLQPREYRAGMEDVAGAVRAALGHLPRWTYVGSATGPTGTQIQATHTSLVFRFKDDVAVTLKPAGPGRTKVSVRSRSRLGKWDFGQNARNVRELMDELDRRLPAS